jgi:arylsulfatase A-like enzyme
MKRDRARQRTGRGSTRTDEPAAGRYRRPVGLLAAGVLVAGVAIWMGIRIATPPPGGPVVLISVDTLRADHLSAYGYKALVTPAIDALAADGVLFERAYSHVPTTLPAHTSMLSGLLPFEHGVRDNVGSVLASGYRLLPEWLRERGFETGGIVSADVLRGDTGISRGFDFFDSDMPAVSGDVSSDRVRRDGSRSLEIAERWIGERPTSKFFMFLHLYEPHAPYTAPAQYQSHQPYDAAIAYADDIVARLLTFLKKRRLYESATILFLSDHGEGLGDHGEQEHGLFLYDATIRIPLIVKLPRSVSHGRRVAAPVQQIDVVPTVLDLLGVPIPPSLRGRTLRQTLTTSAPLPDGPGIYAESFYGRLHFGWSELRSLTDAQYRFIRAPREELYDLRSDPTQLRNIEADRPRTAVAMRLALELLAKNAPVARPDDVSEERRARLASLGYVTTQADVSPRVPADQLADPKDKIEVLDRYRRVLELVQAGNTRAAIALLRTVLSAEPSMTDLWFQLGTLCRQAGMDAEAADAYRHVLRLTPNGTSGALALSSLLLKGGRFAEARDTAAIVLSDRRDARDTAAAHELLARIALAADDPATARKEAAAAAAADPTLPLPDYIEGRIQYAAGAFDRASVSFDRALQASRGRTRQVAELHLFAGDTLAHLGRFEDAEKEFREEIRYFPANIWAHASLVNLYQSERRTDERNAGVSAMLRAARSSEAYGLAARLLTEFGEREQAAAIRAASIRLFGTGAPAP